MREKNKIIVWLKGLPIALTGLVAFIGIMLLLTAIFNWFWTGLGTDPTRTFYAPFTTNFNDFKEYAALYLPLISFGATLFAGFVVFLVFNDWKEPKQYELEKQYAENVLNHLNEIHKDLSSSYYRVFIKNRVFKEDIIINSLKKEKNESIEHRLYQSSAEMKTLSLISNNNELVKIFKGIEMQILILNGAIEHVEKKYKSNYYYYLPNSDKEGYRDKVKDRVASSSIPNSAVRNFSEVFSNEILVEVQEYHQGPYKPYSFTYEKHKENYDDEYKKIVQILVDIIKLK